MLASAYLPTSPTYGCYATLGNINYCIGHVTIELL